MKVAVVGAGLVGRLMALQLHWQGEQVGLFDALGPLGEGSCTYVGAGMLTPWAELETADDEVVALGKASLLLWPQLLQQLSQPVFFQQHGSLMVAHRRDLPELKRMQQRLGQRLTPEEKLNPQVMSVLAKETLATLEPDLAGRFDTALFFAQEAQIDNRQLLTALDATLQNVGVALNYHTPVSDIRPYQITVDETTMHFDSVIDCRGLGAKCANTPSGALRGVRGELIKVHAPEVTLNRPVRLMHPRYSIYIAPRQHHHYLIGATSVESQDNKPLTVHSALELLSAAYSLHTGFAEASIVELCVQHRPAYANNLPAIYHQPGLMQINGLYRHGFLATPKLVELALGVFKGHNVDSAFRALVHAALPSSQLVFNGV